MGGREDDRKPFGFGGHSGPRRPARRDAPGWLKPALLAALVVGGAVAYLYLVDRDLGRRLLGDTPLAPLAPPATVTTGYKWRDARGQWQLTDTPPPEGTPYESITVSSDANIVPSTSRD